MESDVIEERAVEQVEASSLAAQLAKTQGELARAKTAREIDVALLLLGVTDLEAGHAQVEKQLEKAGPNDARAVRKAVEEVRKRKTNLFGGNAGTVPTGATSAAKRRDLGISEADKAAQRALSTGDRKSVLEYLRLKRGT